MKIVGCGGAVGDGGCGGFGGGLLVIMVVMVCDFVNCEWVGCVVCDRGQSNLAN